MSKVFPQVRLDGKTANDKIKAATYVRRGQQELFSLHEMRRTSKRPILQRSIQVDDYTTILVQIVGGQEFINIYHAQPVPVPVVEEEPEEELEEEVGCLPGFIVYNREGATSPTHYGHHISMNDEGNWVHVSSDEARGAETYWNGMEWHFDKRNDSKYYDVDKDSVQAKFPGLGECSVITWRDGFCGGQPTQRFMRQALDESVAPTLSWESSTRRIQRPELFLAGVRINFYSYYLVYGACILPNDTEKCDYMYVLSSKYLYGVDDDEAHLKSGAVYVWKKKLKEISLTSASWDFVSKVDRIDLLNMGYEEDHIDNDYTVVVPVSPYITPEGDVYITFSTYLQGASYSEVGTAYIWSQDSPEHCTHHTDPPSKHRVTLSEKGTMLSDGGYTNLYHSGHWHDYWPGYNFMLPTLKFKIDDPIDEGDVNNSGYVLTKAIDAEEEGLWSSAFANTNSTSAGISSAKAHYSVDECGSIELDGGGSQIILDVPNNSPTSTYYWHESSGYAQTPENATPLYCFPGYDDVYTLRGVLNRSTIFNDSGTATSIDFPNADPDNPRDQKHNFYYDYLCEAYVTGGHHTLDLLLVKGKEGEKRTLLEFRAFESIGTGGLATTTRTAVDDGKDWWVLNDDDYVNSSFARDGYLGDGAYDAISSDFGPRFTNTERYLYFIHPLIPELTAYLEIVTVIQSPQALYASNAYSEPTIPATKTISMAYYVGGEQQWKVHGPGSTESTSTIRSNYHNNEIYYSTLPLAPMALGSRYIGMIDQFVDLFPVANGLTSYGFSSWFGLNDTPQIGPPFQGTNISPSTNSNVGQIPWVTYERGATHVWTSCAVHPKKMPNGERPYLVYLKNLHPNLDASSSVWYRNRSPTIGYEGYDLTNCLVYQKPYGTELDGKDGEFFSNFITLDKLQKLVGEEDSDFPLSFGIV